MSEWPPLNDSMIDTFIPQDIRERGGLLICNISRRGQYIPAHFFEIFPSAVTETLASPFLRPSKFPPYVLEVFVIPGAGKYR